MKLIELNPVPFNLSMHKLDTEINRKVGVLMNIDVQSLMENKISVWDLTWMVTTNISVNLKAPTTKFNLN